MGERAAKNKPVEMEYLHIGDYITVYDDANDGFIGAEGISSIHVGMRATSDPLHPKLVSQEAIFLVRQQHNYSVFRQIKMFLEREGLDPEDAKSVPQYRELLKAR